MPKSYNGWTASPVPSDFGGLRSIEVGDARFGVRAGACGVVLEHVARRFDATVEPLVGAQCGCYNYRANVNNPNTLSCHASATAIDLNWSKHPNGKRGTFTAAQVAAIRVILAECGGVIVWLGDAEHTVDEMHFEIKGTAVEVQGVAARLTAPPAPAVPARPVTPTVAPAVPASPVVLQEGSSGPAVKLLQAGANRIYPGYRSTPLAADGDFGARTTAFVKEFQGRSGLRQDGIVGPATRAKLFATGVRF